MAAQDGASSISVAVRVRPFTIREAAQLSRNDESPLFLGDGALAGSQPPKLSQKGLRSILKVVDDRCLVFDPPEDNPMQRFSKSVIPAGAGRRIKDQTFAFDKVFDENITQGDVYESTTKGLLDSVLDGYNATVFAYGATGCGKTHTITGTVQQPGIIFLTMQELFERISDVQEEKVTEISLSFLEIYNETIRDLLAPATGKAGLMLREDAHQAVSVPGLSSHNPQNVEEVMDMVVRGNENRTMSPTDANATSSRSHAVLQINVSQKDRNADINEPHTMATLSIIDLAGSERASATKNRGERLAEGANINKSLLALGSCINALCDPRRKNHVPYRNSKLTRLLKFSLGGNCKTVMIVCVSPSSAHFDETQNTLRYANRAKNIQTKVSRNVFNVNRHVKDFLKKIDEQMTLINELRAQQKDHENVSFGKFRKQAEKREAIAKEGILRLRNSYENCLSERQERMNSMKKLRQIERRISVLNAWVSAFDYVCDSKEDQGLPENVANLRKTALGILAELEQSRSHYHGRLGKSNWQRAIDSALQTGLKQLQEAEGETESGDIASLEREAECLKSNAEREMITSVLEQERACDSAMTQDILRAHFEAISMATRVMTMSQEDAVQSGRQVLQGILKSCSEAAHHIIKPDNSVASAEAFPPTRTGTPKKRKTENSTAASPAKPSLLPPVSSTARFSISPVKASPRRYRVGSPRKGVAFVPKTSTPKKKSPAKRAVRWRDDTEDGALAEWSKTPQRIEDSTPETATSDVAPPPARSEVHPRIETDENSSSPIPPPPQTSLETKPKSGRFQTGFLSRKGNGSPPVPTLTQMSSSPDPSPLQEVAVNRMSPGRPVDGGLKKPAIGPEQSENNGITSSSDSSSDESKNLTKALKRASLGRSSSVKDSARAHRRRSPPTASNGSPPGDSGLFTASHARRMVKSDRDLGGRHSVLSPHSTPIISKDPGHARRVTMSGDRGPRHSNVRLSMAGPGSANRGSMVVRPKTNWR